MDADAFRVAAERLKEVDDVIVTLDESIRPAAFAVLRPYVDGRASPAALKHEDSDKEDGNNDAGDALIVDPDEARSFLIDRHSDKPAQNVKAIAALFYSRFGTSEFTAQEVREIAHEAGITVSERVDVTLGSAKVSKKSLFRKVRSGVYRPTVHGEKYFKETFEVSRGTGQRPELRS